jgi:phosphotransferase system IIA component
MKKINHLHVLLAKHKLKRGKFRGSGFNMLLERYNRLKAGDHVWDADLGYLVWSGSEWLSDTFTRANSGKVTIASKEDIEEARANKNTVALSYMILKEDVKYLPDHLQKH